MIFPFAKYQAAGNDFILIDDRKEIFPVSAPLVKRFCHRHYGIGADGLILLQNSKKADFRMRIFNSDGSEAEMCGNGIRCLFHFAQTLGFHSKLQIETIQETLSCYFVESKIAVLLPNPEIRHELAFVSGVPHLITFVDNLASVDVGQSGRRLRFDPRFAPHGTNATFAQRLPDNTLQVATYERGVEKETLACGTGAIAAAFLAHETFPMPDLIKVLTPSKELLEITRTSSRLELKGPVAQVFCGMIASESITSLK